jgi:hypothetical protein
VSERLLRTRDVAERLDVSCETVLRWHRSGKLPGGELRWRLKQSEKKFRDIPLAALEGMADEIAGYAVTLSERLRYPLMAAFLQACEAGARYGYLTRNSAKLGGAVVERSADRLAICDRESDQRLLGLQSDGECLGRVVKAGVTEVPAGRPQGSSGPLSQSHVSLTLRQTRRDLRELLQPR